MTLRRTPLKRTEFRRGPVRVSKPARRPRDTGPTPATRAAVAERANWCCELCGQSLYTVDVGWTAAHSFHHRRARGMGGTTRPESNGPANLLLVCGTGTTGCHGRIESNRTWAVARGLLVPQMFEPTDVVVVLLRGRVTLTDHGTYEEAV